MEALKHTFPNGLRLLTVPMPSLTSATVTVWVGVGSRYETENISGISHFLEHMVFKGGKKYPSAKIISETLDAMGASFNASTSQEITNFYVKARAELLPKACDVLSDMVLFPKLDTKDINRERGVIIEELNMYEDNPMYKVGNLFEETMFEGNPLGWDIGGTKKTVSKITQNNFNEFRDEYYKPSNMLVTVSGGVAEKEAIKVVDKYFGKMPKHPYTRKFTKFNNPQTSPRIKLATKPIEQAHLIVGYFSDKFGNKNRFTEEVLGTILGGGMSSRLFTEVREKRGLAYTVHTSVSSFLDTGSIETYAAVDPKKITEALKVILEEHNKITSHLLHINSQELSKAKEYIKGHIALSLESTNAVGSFFGHDEILLGKTETPEEVFKGVDAVTAKDVMNLAKEKFIKNKLNLAIVGPFKDGNEFQKVLKSA